MPEGSDQDARFIEQLRKDLMEIHYRWCLVRELWELTAKKLRLIHSFGVDFFSVVQSVQVEDLIISLARFTDEGRDRVELSRAIKLVFGKSELTAAAKRLAAIRPKIKEYRDRVLAHREYSLHIAANNVKPLAGITWGDLREFIAEVTSLMRAVDKAYDGSFHAYEDPIRMGSWGIIFDALADAEHLHSLQDRARAGLRVTERDVLPPGQDEPRNP